jgi:hypothetical protein
MQGPAPAQGIQVAESRRRQEVSHVGVRSGESFARRNQRFLMAADVGVVAEVTVGTLSAST